VKLSRNGAVRMGILLATAVGCSRVPPPVPADPWTGRVHAHGLDLRGLGLGFPPWMQGPLASVEEDPETYPPTASVLEKARGFALVLRQGSNFLNRFDRLEIDAEGRATLTFGAPRRRATFRLSREELDRIEAVLVLIDVLHLKKSYSAGAEDGGQWYLEVTASGRKKSVGCDNHFPAEVVLLSEFLRKEILGPRRAEIEAAPEVGPQR
jgi:hypothetical protein